MQLTGIQLDHYRVLNPIKSGGTSEVYRAEDMALLRQVAIKIIQSTGASYPNTSLPLQGTAYTFFAEMRTIAGLDYPHILPLLDFGERTNNGLQLFYIVMPLCLEGSLADWIRRRNGTHLLPINDIASIVRQAAEALYHLHSKGIVHGDVKPSSFLVRERIDRPNCPDLFLAGFGTPSQAKVVNASTEYVAPERFYGHVTPASDQYALGVMAYELLTGSVPFKGTPEQLLSQHVYTEPLLPSRLNPRVPSTLDAVILRALAKNPASRFPRTRDFADAFEQALRSQKSATPAGGTKPDGSAGKPFRSDHPDEARHPGGVGRLNNKLFTLRGILIALVILVITFAGSLAVTHGVFNSTNNIQVPAQQQTVSPTQSAVTQARSQAATATAQVQNQVDATATAQASAVTPTPTPTLAPDFSPFVGKWISHHSLFTFNADGHAQFMARTYSWCGPTVPPPCDSIQGNTIVPGIQEEMLFTRVVGSTAYGVLTSSTDGHVGDSVSATLQPNDSLTLRGFTKIS